MSMPYSEWYSPGKYDSELMYYQWRAYHARARAAIEQERLFPYWYDLKKRISDLEEILGFREVLTEYTDFHVVEDPVEDLMEMSTHALQELSSLLAKGEQLREQILAGIEMERDELQPRSPLSGILLVSTEGVHGTKAFSYHYKGFTSLSPASNIRLEYLGNHVHEEMDTVKLRLKYVQENNLQTLPSTFHFHSSGEHPFYPTVLPLVREIMVDRLLDASPDW